MEAGGFQAEEPSGQKSRGGEEACVFFPGSKLALLTPVHLDVALRLLE